MTLTHTEVARPQAARAAADRREAEALLRDAAFVMHLTCRVRASIEAGRRTRPTGDVTATAVRTAARN